MDLSARKKLGFLRQPSLLAESIWETPPKRERKNPKVKGTSEKTSKCKKGKCFRAYHKQVFSLTPERYQVVLYYASNPGLITAPLKPVSDHISLAVMLWECVMTGMQYCCCTHAVAHRFIFLCAGLCVVVFILTCMTSKKNLPPLWEESLPCFFSCQTFWLNLCFLCTEDNWCRSVLNLGSRDYLKTYQCTKRNTGCRIQPSLWRMLFLSYYYWLKAGWLKQMEAGLVTPRRTKLEREASRESCTDFQSSIY